MSIKFNNLNNNYNNYNNYNYAIQNNIQNEEAKNVENKEATQKSTNEFIGLDDDRDLLTQNNNYVFISQLTRKSNNNKEIADETNNILESLGFDYKVTEQQVKSVQNGVNNVVLPGLQKVDEAVVEAHIQDPNGPFADLFC